MNAIRRTLQSVVRVVDEARGLVDYIASDESIDSYNEIVRADGWRFNLFKKNAPFVDSHVYNSIEKLLGRVVDFRVSGRKLIERVQWAIDVPENELAQLGWKMTVGGYLKAVSVGFMPIRMIGRMEGSAFQQELQKLQLPKPDAERVRLIYLEQEQIELSACLIGANANALAKACRDGYLNDREVETLRGSPGVLNGLGKVARSIERVSSHVDAAQRANGEIYESLCELQKLFRSRRLARSLRRI